MLLYWNATDWVYFSVFRWDAKGHCKNTIIFSSSGSCKPCFCNFLLCMICTGLPRCKNLWSFSLFSSHYFPWLYCVDLSVASLYSLFYVSCEFHRFLHRGWTICTCNASVCLKCAYWTCLRAIAVVLTTPERMYRKKNNNERSELEGLFNWNNYALWITVAIARAVRAKRQRNVRFTRGSTQTATWDY